MKTRYRLIRRGIRGGVYYCVDTKTGKRTSLGINDEDEARQILEARNNSERQPALNLQITRSYLIASDAAWMQRTWRDAALDPFALKKNIEVKLKKFFTVLSYLNGEATKLI